MPYSDKMESLESCFFADSSDFICSVNRSRSPEAVDKVAAAVLVEALWGIKDTGGETTEREDNQCACEQAGGRVLDLSFAN